MTILPIRGAVQHYDWGGYDLIPGLIGLDNRARKPFAELWFSAHPGAPAMVDCDGSVLPLDRWIAGSPVAALGAAVAERYGGRLPYLLKVLDARSMLSIQAHPAKRQAEEGFARENAAGIDMKAPQRNYKDDNHKPEVQVALTEFWMLHGFRPLESISAVLNGMPEFAALQAFDSIRALYETVMSMPQPQVEAMLGPLVERLRHALPAGKDQPGFWALRAAGQYGLDRGIFFIYLLNLIHLHPGEGTYQPAGVLHAYLEGANVELMANSDNVLRGGLTPKYVDVEELMRILTFECGEPEVLHGQAASGSETVYRTPAEEFALSRITVEGVHQFAATAEGPDTLLVLEGEAKLASGGASWTLSRGRSVFVPYGSSYSLGGSAVLYRARVPFR